MYILLDAVESYFKCWIFFFLLNILLVMPQFFSPMVHTTSLTAWTDLTKRCSVIGWLLVLWIPKVGKDFSTLLLFPCCMYTASCYLISVHCFRVGFSLCNYTFTLVSQALWIFQHWPLFSTRSHKQRLNCKSQIHRLFLLLKSFFSFFYLPQNWLKKQKINSYISECVRIV